MWGSSKDVSNCSYLCQYAQEEGREFELSAFYDGAEILENYAPKYDLILLDIEMPKVNGMDADCSDYETYQQQL